MTKILMILTSHDRLGDTGEKTGFWLEEFAAPYYVFKDAGAEITLASPQGGQPPLDPKSDTEDFQTDATRRFKEDAEAQELLANTERLDEIYPTQYDAVFIVHVLEHVTDPVQTFSAIERLLTPGGRAFAVVPNGHAASRQIACHMGLIDHCTALTEGDLKHGHRRTYVLDTLENDAKKAGLKIVHRGGIFFKPFANFQFDGLFGNPLMSDAYLEGCFQLGFKYPYLTASIFVVVERDG